MKFRSKLSSHVHHKPSMKLDRDEKTTSGVDVAKVQARIDSLGGLFWTVPEGTSVVRVLPPTPAYKGDFAIMQTLHYGFKDQNDKGRAVACLRAHGEDCPICTFVDELGASSDPDDKKLADDLRAKTNLLTEIVVRGSKRVKLWRMPVGIYRTLGAATAEPRVGDFTDRLRGRDISVVRKGQGLRTKYTVTILDRCKLGVKVKAQRQNMSRLKAPVLPAKKLARLLAKFYG